MQQPVMTLSTVLLATYLNVLSPSHTLHRYILNLMYILQTYLFDAIHYYICNVVDIYTGYNVALSSMLFICINTK